MSQLLHQPLPLKRKPTENAARKLCKYGPKAIGLGRILVTLGPYIFSES